jgi:hypothetical protein
MPDPVGPTPEIIKKDEAPPARVSWYQSPQVLAAVAAIGGGAVAFCSAFHIIIPFSAIEVTAGIGGLLSVLGGGFALYRRIRVGLDPANNASKITLL